MSNEEINKLVRKAQRGDRKAFARLYRICRPLVCGCIACEFKNPCKNPHSRFVRLVFRKVRRKLSTFKFKSKFSTWLYSVTKNTQKDLERAEQRQWKDKYISPRGVLNDKFQMMRAFIRNELANSNVKMSKSLRITLENFGDGLSFKEIARKSKRSVNTIKTRIYRSLRKFKQHQHYRNLKLTKRPMIGNRLEAVKYRVLMPTNKRATRRGAPLMIEELPSESIPKELLTKRKDTKPYPRWASPYSTHKKQ